ncbi:MAG: regulatory protein GemA [Zoogloeaceae bacterium]|jgi:hypothetical protein|nr:regulatory protein GemA [Zoogloeaceae bacterium]
MSALDKHYRQLLGITKNWAEKSLPGWDDDCHRDLLRRHGARIRNDKVSATTMTVAQIGAALDDYERRGWPKVKKFASKAGEARAVPPGISHIVRLWGKLGQAGKVQNPTRLALLAFSSR